jgi:hypothetical protein
VIEVIAPVLGNANELIRTRTFWHIDQKAMAGFVGQES